jgi:hypothetical protein
MKEMSKIESDPMSVQEIWEKIHIVTDKCVLKSSSIVKKQSQTQGFRRIDIEAALSYTTCNRLDVVSRMGNSGK